MAQQTENHQPISNTGEAQPAKKGRPKRTQAAFAGVAEPPGQTLNATDYLPKEVEKLLDIRAASSLAAPALPLNQPPPQAVMMVVNGVDDRRQILNTRDFPWRAHCYLLITDRTGGPWLGTGWLVSPRTVITAGHCVFIRDKENPGAAHNGWVSKIEVMPGRNGAVLPFAPVVSTRFESVKGWLERGDEASDYGAIFLPAPIGATLGWLGFQVFTDAQLAAQSWLVAGYPGPDAQNPKPEGTVWGQANRLDNIGPFQLSYDIDTTGGQSGSPVLSVNADRRVCAIHTTGDNFANSGTRITPEVAVNLNRWHV